MKKLLLGAAALAIVSATPAQAYVGDWLYDNNQGGWEVLRLGDNETGGTRYLEGSERYCGKPGASYATMRATIEANYPGQIVWWVDRTCDDDHVRICVENRRGMVRCSTYYDKGWR